MEEFPKLEENIAVLDRHIANLKWQISTLDEQKSQLEVTLNEVYYNTLTAYI
jgi:CII-binding regulator of phage lambda lysogenization HflD